MKTLVQSLRLLAALTVLTGLLYPLAVWAFGQAFFRHAAEGSLLYRDGRPVGSALIAQKTSDPRYFWPRASAVDQVTVPSGAGNQAWTNAKLREAVRQRQQDLGAAAPVPGDLLTASGSGLDPHLSPDAVKIQAERVQAARGLSPAQRLTLDELVARHTEGGQIAPARINVLELNLALDAALPTP